MINALIVGYGSVGRRHANILSKNKFIKKIYILTAQKKILFDRISSLQEIDTYDIDYIIIANRTNLHFESLKYIEKNYNNKIILVEKPIYSKFSNLKILKNKVWVGYNLRFHPGLQLIKRLIKNKIIWSIEIKHSSYLPDWRNSIDYKKSNSAKKIYGGGVLRELSHELDMINFLFGDIQINHAYSNKISNLKVDVDDILILLGSVMFRKKTAFISLAINFFSRHRDRYIIVEGNNISIKVDLFKNTATYLNNGVLKKIRFPKLSLDQTYIDLHNAILNNISNASLCSYKEGLDVLKIIDKIERKYEKK